jgi:hypothetical protein
VFIETLDRANQHKLPLFPALHVADMSVPSSPVMGEEVFRMLGQS